MGTEFEKGMILGRNQRLVEQKTEEKCEEIKRGMISMYVNDARKSKERNGESFTSTAKFFSHG